MRPRKLEHQALPGRWAAITRVLIRITRRSELAGNLLRAALLCAPRRLCLALRPHPRRTAPRRATCAHPRHCAAVPPRPPDHHVHTTLHAFHASHAFHAHVPRTQN